MKAKLVDLDTHLVSMPGHVVLDCPCGCKGKGTRLARCRKNRCVIARCATAGANMERACEMHEKECR